MYRLITGCGRSGTKYIAKVLQLAGLDVEHEALGKDGSVSWPLAFASDSYPECQQSVKYPEFDVVLHQVRHPLKVIKSFMTVASPYSWDYVYRQTPITPDLSLLDRRVRYWYYWNLQAESIADMTYRIENLKNRWGEFCDLMQINLNYGRLSQVPKDTNAKIDTKKHRRRKRRKSRLITWKRIENNSDFYTKVIKLGRRYGYKL